MQPRKKLLVISRRDDRVEYDTAPSMAASLNAVAVAYTTDHSYLENIRFVYDGNTLSVTDSVSGNPLDGYDGIFMIGWFKSKMLEEVALSVAIYAEARGIKLLNSETSINRSKSKVSQLVHGTLNGIRTTPFVFQLDSSSLADSASEAGISFPAIFKAVNASRGRSNFLVNGPEDIRKLVSETPDIPFVLQEYVPNDGDFRVLVIGGAVKLVIHRTAQEGSHLNNTSQGGAAALVDSATLDPSMIADSIKIASLLNREITGVDMIVSKNDGSYYFLEANNMPQLSTGSFTAEKSAALDSYFSEWLK